MSACWKPRRTRLCGSNPRGSRVGLPVFLKGSAARRRTLEAPARQIAVNSAVDGGVVVSKMLETNSNVGFDAARNRYVDLFEAGIIDPTKVVRVALENAVSVASVLLLTEATMTEIPVDKKAPAAEIEA
ncbi:MAG TPA: TCP-1/cpn60 chaperonin family protein [Steroidobacter sp.]